MPLSTMTFAAMIAGDSGKTVWTFRMAMSPMRIDSVAMSESFVPKSVSGVVEVDGSPRSCQ
jgi:hypothetical protein